MKRLIAPIAALLILGAFAGPALAGKSIPTGDIELAGSTERVAGGNEIRYGEAVAFETVVEGRMGPKSRVYVTLVCAQDGQVVYEWSAGVDFSFPLVDQEGQGLDWDGAEAECTGALMYYEEGGKSPLIANLDQTEFTAQAA
jgi:hypothetical protein